jgi:hypothetical protein
VLRAAIELLQAGAAAVQHINRQAAAALREVRGSCTNTLLYNL